MAEISEVAETVIMRSKASNTLYDVVEIDMEGEVVNPIARSVNFEQAQKILESLFPDLETVL
jgi:rRNA processing protein Krr1/Pno1